jgi:hypothetical protein
MAKNEDEKLKLPCRVFRCLGYLLYAVFRIRKFLGIPDQDHSIIKQK